MRPAPFPQPTFPFFITNFLKMELLITSASHRIYAKEIADCIEASAAVRGTGIARRTPEYIITKMENRNRLGKI